MSGYFTGRSSVEFIGSEKDLSKWGTDMKLIAFYLPQFHEIPENNDAWGNGFTEWTNVRKSRPLFLGHCQPKTPLNNNYYNLLNKEVMEWQSHLAEKAGLYGFCFYHYWFNGRMVLEKPVRNWLVDKRIKTHFCFAWANEPWTKTWHGAGGNKEILIPQTYGGKEEWQRHYDYFREFFLDERYIKEDNRPMLVLYRLKNIPRFNQMLRFWNDCARRDGFSGIFAVSMNVCREPVEKSIWVDATVDFEPNKTKSEMLVHQGNSSLLEPKPEKSIIWNRMAVKQIDYDEINQEMINKKHGKNHFRTVFVNYDDSPRRNERAVITHGASPRKFGKYLRKMMERSQEEGNEYLFVNAWNEWGEGNYLEPDTKYRYAYLNELRKCTGKNTIERKTRHNAGI